MPPAKGFTGSLPEVGRKYWFLHPKESWIVGKVLKIEDEKSGLVKMKPDEIYDNQNPPLEEAAITADDNTMHMFSEMDINNDLDNLLNMAELHEGPLLHLVKSRFLKDQIYTYIGPLILSLNPFKWTIPWVQNDQMARYIKKDPTVFPHAWAVADFAFRTMNGGGGNQSIIISGESGAGKTEACKSIINYLCELSCSLTDNMEVKKIASGISEKIRKASPILEAFGNAKTVNNDNSSRFGKFIKIQFNKDGIIQGAITINYLLEKSRLMNQGKGERGYHIFYQMCKGMSAEEKKFFKLKNAGEYKCLTVGNLVEDPKINDKEDYEAVRNAMNTVGMSSDEQKSIFSVCATILHLQNIEFIDNPETTSVDVTSGTKEELKISAELLKVSEEKLKLAITTKTIVIMKKSITSPLTVDTAKDARDGLSKALYSSMFDWIVEKINTTTCATKFDSFIGLLDIFGFERFEKNSFEQLCINFANESLQGHYNNHTFTLDILECQKEGIDTSIITFNDNLKCLDLIQGGKTAANKWGVLTCLDESCIFPKATDKTFLELCVKNFIKEPNAKAIYPDFSINPRAPNCFKVKHYAGEVEYDVDGWLDKNKDLLKEDSIDLIDSSKEDFFKVLLKEKIEDLKAEREGKNKKKKLTVGGSFKQQLNELLATLNSTTPYWIRTIKPHKAKKPGMFSGVEVLSQLSSSGVLETIRIRKEGYAVRVPHLEFFKNFKILLKTPPAKDWKTFSEQDALDYCKLILSDLGFEKDKAQVGKTKVFLRTKPYQELSTKKIEKLTRSIAAVQNAVRTNLVQRDLFTRHQKKEIEKMKTDFEQVKVIIEIINAEKERKRKEEEERKRIEEERRRILEEERKKREEAIRKIREEKERIEREKREREEREKREREEAERKERERIEEIKRLEQERIRKEEEEKRRIQEEKDRIERERVEEIKRQFEERRLALLAEQEKRMREDQERRLAAIKEKYDQKRKEKIVLFEKNKKLKDKAKKKVEQELKERRVSYLKEKHEGYTSLRQEMKRKQVEKEEIDNKTPRAGSKNGWASSGNGYLKMDIGGGYETKKPGSGGGKAQFSSGASGQTNVDFPEGGLGSSSGMVADFTKSANYILENHYEPLSSNFLQMARQQFQTLSHMQKEQEDAAALEEEQNNLSEKEQEDDNSNIYKKNSLRLLNPAGSLNNGQVSAPVVKTPRVLKAFSFSNNNQNTKNVKGGNDFKLTRGDFSSLYKMDASDAGFSNSHGFAKNEPSVHKKRML